jgi:hypothetical protein
VRFFSCVFLDAPHSFFVVRSGRFADQNWWEILWACLDTLCETTYFVLVQGAIPWATLPPQGWRYGYEKEMSLCGGF